MKSYASATNVADYVESLFQPEDDVLREIRERTARVGMPAIQVGTMDSLHLEVLTRALGARKAVEIGTLGGYSGTAIARGLAPGGVLHTFELSPGHAEAARESFVRAGVETLVQIHVGPALERLREIENDGPFDLVFIDADKAHYPAYLDWAADHLRTGGAVLGDNTLAWGMISDETFESPDDRVAVTALREFNRRLARDGRFRSTLLPTGEGLTLGVRVR